jgi:uncharacterized membrane protein
VNARSKQDSSAHAHILEPIEHAIRWILLCGIALSVALMAAGLVLGVAQGTGLPRGVVPLAEIAGALVALRPAAYLSLGLIVLIGTPFVRVAGSLVIFVRARDGRYVLVTAIVLFVMCLGVALGRI